MYRTLLPKLEVCLRDVHQIRYQEPSTHSEYFSLSGRLSVIIFLRGVEILHYLPLDQQFKYFKEQLQAYGVREKVRLRKQRKIEESYKREYKC